MPGSLGSYWGNEVQSPVCFQEKYLVPFYCPYTWGIEDWWSGGKGAEGNGHILPVLQKEKTKD